MTMFNPPHPGGLITEYLEDYNVSLRYLAKGLGVSKTRFCRCERRSSRECITSGNSSVCTSPGRGNGHVSPRLASSCSSAFPTCFRVHVRCLTSQPRPGMRSAVPVFSLPEPISSRRNARKNGIAGSLRPSLRASSTLIMACNAACLAGFSVTGKLPVRVILHPPSTAG